MELSKVHRATIGVAYRTPRFYIFALWDLRRNSCRMASASINSRPAYTAALLRHFADLRDGTHGGASSRRDKERLFTAAVGLLDPYARQVLDEINRYLLLDTGEVSATGVRRSADGG